MLLFLDTEYTALDDPELIYIGIVSTGGHEFYAEFDDFDSSACSDFVRENVLPLLGKEPAIKGPKSQIREALNAWLSQFDEAVIGVDHEMDWTLFCDLMYGTDAIPGNIAMRLIWSNMDIERLENYYLIYRTQHHALHDARANRFAYTSASSFR